MILIIFSSVAATFIMANGRYRFFYRFRIKNHMGKVLCTFLKETFTKEVSLKEFLMAMEDSLWRKEAIMKEKSNLEEPMARESIKTDSTFTKVILKMIKNTG
jgi:hypothetical protein